MCREKAQKAGQRKITGEKKEEEEQSLESCKPNNSQSSPRAGNIQFPTCQSTETLLNAYAHQMELLEMKNAISEIQCHWVELRAD